MNLVTAPKSLEECHALIEAQRQVIKDYERRVLWLHEERAKLIDDTDTTTVQKLQKAVAYRDGIIDRQYRQIQAFNSIRTQLNQIQS